MTFFGGLAVEMAFDRLALEGQRGHIGLGRVGSDLQAIAHLAVDLHDHRDGFVASSSAGSNFGHDSR